jgi:hypothetical protein
MRSAARIERLEMQIAEQASIILRRVFFAPAAQFSNAELQLIQETAERFPQDPELTDAHVIATGRLLEALETESKQAFRVLGRDKSIVAARPSARRRGSVAIQPPTPLAPGIPSIARSRFPAATR